MYRISILFFSSNGTILHIFSTKRSTRRGEVLKITGRVDTGVATLIIRWRINEGARDAAPRLTIRWPTPRWGTSSLNSVVLQGIIAGLYGELVLFRELLSKEVTLFGRDLLPTFNFAMEGKESLCHVWLCCNIVSLLFHGICQLGRVNFIPLGCCFQNQNQYGVVVCSLPYRVDLDPLASWDNKRMESRVYP